METRQPRVLPTTGPLGARRQGHGRSRAEGIAVQRAQRGRFLLGLVSRLPDATIGSWGGCRCNSEVVPEVPESPVPARGVHQQSL